MASGLEQLLGNPNALQALLAASPLAAQQQPVADEDNQYTRLPTLPALQQGGAAYSGLGSGLGEALGNMMHHGGGAQPMDEVPRPEAPAVDEDASPRDEVAGVESAVSGNAPPDVLSGLGPDLQQNMGLGAAHDEDAPGAGGASAPMGGGGGYGMPQMPQMPVLDEHSLYPSRKRAILQGVIPGIAALFAGLAGGKESAAALMMGANRANEQANADLKQRGLLRYERSKQQYARDVALYNQSWTHAKDRASILSDLAKKAAEFDDPDVAKQWLASQRKIYAPFGVDTMDAMPGGVLPGAKEKIAAQATKVYKEAMDELRKNNPGSTFDVAKMNAGNSIMFRGKLMTLGELAALGNVAKPVPGAPDGISSSKTDANAIFQDLVDGYRESTGKEPDSEQRAGMRLQALQDFAKASAKPPDELTRQITQARLALMQLQRAKLLAGGHPDGISNLNPGQLRFGMSVATRYEKASQPFNQRAQNYDTINSLASGPSTSEGDIAMVFAWMKMLDPTSTVREGEQAQVRNARGVPDSIKMMYNNLLSNQALSLTKQQKLEIVGGAHRLYSSLAKGQQQLFDNSAQQLRAYKVAPGLFLSPQGSVNDTSPYRTLDIENETRPLPEGVSISTAPKAKTAPPPSASPIAPPQASDAARGTATPSQARTIALPTGAPKTAPQAAPAQVAPKGAQIVKGKDGKLYQIFGKDANGKLIAKPLDQYF
jgi:hypothetical protein